MCYLNSIVLSEEEKLKNQRKKAEKQVQEQLNSMKLAAKEEGLTIEEYGRKTFGMIF